MKIRKTIALLTAFAMIAAMVPAMALTAFAADPTAILLEDGSAYKVRGGNLIEDGSFETDQWDKQLTTGKVIGGNDGVDYVIDMNTDARGAVPFARISDARTGSYALTVVQDKMGTGGMSINGPNGAASIKHYIENTTSANQTYYVSFYAKGLTDDAQLTYYAEGVGSSNAPTDYATANLASEWTKYEKIATVAAGQYLILSICYMEADKVALDDFAVYEIYTDSETEAFERAMRSWNFENTYYNGQTISADMALPTTVGNASVTWVSSNPEIIAVDGKYTAPANDTNVTLTATISLGEFATTKTYTFKTISFFNDIMAIVENSVVRTVGADLKLIDTVPGYAGSVVKWTSSNTSVIANNGEYTAPAAKTDVTLTATVTYQGLTKTTSVDVIAGVVPSLINNAGFDLIEDKTIVGWTVGNGVDAREGGTAPMTTDNFDYVTEDGNSYIVSKGHEGLTGKGSVRTYVDLEPGKAYTLTYDIRYMGDGTCDELYITAGLVNDNGAEAALSYPENRYNGVSYADGWQTIDGGILLPTAGKSTLLIAGKWLNRGGVNKGEGGHQDGRWAMDNFILQEIDPDSKTDVVVKYVGDDGADLGSRTIEGTYAGTTQVATADDKADKTTEDGTTYRYDNTSVDSVKVALGADNTITLKFKKLVPATVTVKFMDRDGNELKPAETADGNVGFVYTATSAQKANIKSADGGVYILEKGADDSVMVQAEGTVLVLYFSYSLNLVENGDFTNGTTGWTSRALGAAITGGTIAYDDAVGGNALSIDTGGRGATNSIGTIWNVETGKLYKLSFDVFAKNITSNNFEWNRVTDAYVVNGAGWDNSGNDIIAYGSRMTMNQWNHFEETFTAKTNEVYFQSGWAEGVKLANVMLTEIDESKVGSVTINYLDKETNTALKTAKSVGEVVAGTNYKVEDADKANITVNGVIYSYDTTSVDNVNVKENVNGVINLYFIKVEVSDVETVTIDTTEDAEITLPETVKVTYNNGTSENVAVTWNAVPALAAGETVEVKGDAAGSETTAVINVFYTQEKPADYDNYNWINVNGTEYPVAKDAENLIANGSFENELEGWTNRFGTAITDATVEENAELGTKVLSMVTGGKSATNSLGTIWNVTTGKRYVLYFSVYGNKPTEANYTYNRVTDAIGTTDVGSRDNQGNNIVEYGKNMETGKWNTFAVDFEAKTDTVYIQSSWSDGVMKFGNFGLYELQGDTYSSETALSKLTVSVDGVETASYVEKGSALPNYRALYPNAVVVNTDGVNTNKPNAGTVVILTTAPELGNSIAIVDGAAVIYAVDEAINGVAVVAQYKFDGVNKELVDVKTTPVNVAVGSEATVAINVVEDAEGVKVMVVESLETMKALATETSASAESKFAPASITPCDETQANQGYIAKAMFDGNKVNTRWTSQMGTNGGSIDSFGGDPNSWVVLDFGKNVSPSAIEIFPNAYERRGTIYDVLTSVDGVNYTTVVEGANTGVGNVSATTELSGSYRYIKVVFRGNDSSDPKWTSVNEIVVK